MKIKEDRVTIGDKPPSKVDDIIPSTKDLGTRYSGDFYDERMMTFWKDMNGILQLLNKNNKRYTIKSMESPIITQYLLWRLLEETKK